MNNERQQEWIDMYRHLGKLQGLIQVVHYDKEFPNHPEVKDEVLTAFANVKEFLDSLKHKEWMQDNATYPESHKEETK